MKLTTEQLLEVFIALFWGRQEAVMAEMSEEQRQRHYERERETIRKSIDAFPSAGQNHRTALAENLKFVGRPEEAEEAVRQRYLHAEGEFRRLRRSGLKQGINDTLHLVEQGYYPPKTIEVINRRLTARNLPKVDELLRQFRGTHLKILKRGRIRDEEEFYLVQNILADLEFDVTEEQRMKLDRLAGEFEQQVRRR